MSIGVAVEAKRLHQARWKLHVDGKLVERFQLGHQAFGISAAWLSLCCGADAQTTARAPRPVCMECRWGCDRPTRYVDLATFREQVEEVLVTSRVEPLEATLAASHIVAHLEVFAGMDPLTCMEEESWTLWP